MASISCSVAISYISLYIKNLVVYELIMDSYMCDYILDKILIADKLLLHFKLSESGHINFVTGFAKRSLIHAIINI